MKRVLIEKLFSSAFHLDDYRKFIFEMFTGADKGKDIQTAAIWKEYSDSINFYQQIAKFTDSDGNKINILAVNVKRSQSVVRARAMQRNFVARMLEHTGYAAAVAAFYSPGDNTWRLSFIRLDYSFESTGLNLELTPAKRYSFLLGVGEPHHTAEKQLLPIFADDTRLPTADDLESAFGVEKVTKEFYDKYKEKYLQTVEHLTENSAFMQQAGKCGFTAEQFAKKMLGQIAFLYFLQKKGWLGVKIVPQVLSEVEFQRVKAQRPEFTDIADKVYRRSGTERNLIYTDFVQLAFKDREGLAAMFLKTEHNQPWGNGEREFIRHLFNNCAKNSGRSNKNFFDDYLEPLFYDALNKRREYNYFDRFNCKIPFLNGGLFEPLDNYDWKNNDFKIPDELFSNQQDKGRDADGILDIFDRFNFTINEDEPLEKEVAIDPEMLGKIFENLLEVHDRKSKGAFYTPREIVHYMCRESLTQYLVNATALPADNLRMFINYSDIMRDADSRAFTNKARLDHSALPEQILMNLDSVDKALATVAVCDPAIGSGAFPLGMMSEIVKARNNITEYMAAKYPIGQRDLFIKSRTAYDLKLRTMRASLFGADIDPSAVDIAKLRLWLALIVDEHVEAGEDPKPLPNLDYNIVCGNSLLEEFEGIQLFEDRKEKQKDMMINLFEDAVDNHINNLRFLQDQLFSEADTDKKKAIKRNIEQEITWLVEQKLVRDNNNIGLDKFRAQLKEKTKPYVLWRLDFALIFRDKGGFDIVIGNPPYLRERDNKDVFEKVNDSSWGKMYHQGKMDYWYYFLHKAIDLAKKEAIITYITPRYWLNSAGAQFLIKRISKELSFVDVVDIGKIKVFDNVVGYHMVSCYKKTSAGNRDFSYKKITNNIEDIAKMYNTENINITKLSNTDIITDKYEIIFQSNSKKSDQIAKLGDICDISQGVVEASDKISKKQFHSSKRTDVSIGDGVFVISRDELDELALSEQELGCIKTYIDGINVSKYNIVFADRYLIYSDKETKKKIASDEGYRNLKRHLDNVREFITSSNGPYGLHRPRDYKYFSNPKILVKSMFKINEFALDVENNFVGMSFSIVISKNEKYDLKYILAILNSKYALKWFYENGKRRGVGVDIGVEKLRSFPIMTCIDSVSGQLVGMVNTIINNSVSDIEAVISGIDRIIYSLYGLSDEEINSVEEFYLSLK
ncbi:MAG: TaqI-like C-terminal specificity domain-containing protein [Negativicutes bacterium]|jgi:adenine-specific DNA-methyltransferase